MAPKLNKGNAFNNMELVARPSDTKGVIGAMRVSGGDYPESLGQTVCQYYMKTGMCKFGSACKYHHPSQGGGSSMPTALNICGYPLRPGEKECSYYVKTGQCKFGVTCKFHHPQPAGVQVAAPVPGPASVIPAAPACTQPNVSSFPAPSGSSPLSDYFADLPQEVFLDIFLRLPLKCIGRSRCVSKPWLSLLTSYEFIKAHLAHHTHLSQDQMLLLLSWFSCPNLFSLTLHLGGNHLRELEFFDEQVHSLVGSCNGLVLVVPRLVVNCMTGESVKVPQSPFPLCQHLSFKKYGFGYVERSDDYIIVKISQCDYGQYGKRHRKCAEILVDIYSLKTRSWKRLGTPLYGHDLVNDSSCVFINGAIHWIGVKSIHTHKPSAVVGAFDLCDEKFTEFLAPASVVNDGSKYWTSKVMVIDGSLGIVADQYSVEKSEIWLMKSYSLVESWTKLVVDFRPLCFHKDKILFSDQCLQGLKWYSVKDGRVEVCLVVNAGMLSFEEGITYSETLVSPHFNYHN